MLESIEIFPERNNNKFEIWTDHKNLEYFIKAQKLNRKQAGWALYLSRFDFTLKHVLESKIGKADSLSRRQDQEIGVKRDNEDEILVKPEQLEVKRTKEVDLLDNIRQSKVKDDEVVKAVEEMKQAEVKMLRDEEWREVHGIIYKEGKVYVPKDKKLRAEIIRLYHNILVEGHGGQQKTVELVTRSFWWPGVIKEVKQYMKGYNSCQKNKNYTEQLASKLMPNSILEKSQSHISAQSYHWCRDITQSQ